MGNVIMEATSTHVYHVGHMRPEGMGLGCIGAGLGLGTVPGLGMVPGVMGDMVPAGMGPGGMRPGDTRPGCTRPGGAGLGCNEAWDLKVKELERICGTLTKKD